MANVTVTLKKDQELSIKDKSESLPRCFLLGEFHMGEFIPNIMQSLSPRATWFFWELVKNRNRVTNIAKVDYPATNNKTEKNKISDGYRELHKLLFVKRIAPKTYIINPSILPPYKDKIDSVTQTWDSIP